MVKIQSNVMQFCRFKALFQNYKCLWTFATSLLLFKRPLVCCSNFPLLWKSSSAFGPEMDSTADVQTKRMTQVIGEGEKKNDVIFCGRFVRAESNVVFFGGDVQDYVENMKSHRDNHHFKQWNLEATAQLLLRRFPSSHIWVIKPAAMELKTFSVYSNFLAWADMSKPLFGEGQNSWRHLSKLLRSAVETMNTYENETTNTCAKDKICSTFNDALPLIIVGFSKGCVVLNQLVYDLESAGEVEFLRQVRAMYWLDGGHNGGSNVWITDKKVLRSLVASGIEVASHVTPYQIKDPSRPWIGREHKQFVSQMIQLGGKITNVVHFSDEERSIENHFIVITKF